MKIRWRHTPPDALSPDAELVPAELLEATAERLRPVRGSMSDDDFAALVRDVVRMKLRWDTPPRLAA
jgi:hypothetical protein